MKTRILTLFLAIVISVGASAVKIKKVWYTLNVNTHTAIVRSPENTSSTYSGNIVIPNTITYSNETYVVTSIGEKAFARQSELKSVTIGDSVTLIGRASFSYCNLISLTIGLSVSEIEDYAFLECIVDSVIWNAKKCNQNLEGVGGVTSVSFGNQVEIIPKNCCSGMNLSSINLPNSVKSIGNSAFYGCGFSSVNIPNSVESIGYSAFQDTKLTSVTIPNSVTSIGGLAFYGCSNLISVYCESNSPAYTYMSGTNQDGSNPGPPIPYSTVVYVPECAYATYHNALIWKDLNIVPVDVNLRVVNDFGGVVVETCGSMEIEAVPFIGYHFKSWQDGNKDNPRKYTLWQSNRNFIAEFELDKHQITLDFEANQGNIIGDKGKFNYGTEHTIEAIANYGYHFTQWSDGETENPRTFVLEQDTIFTAEFAPNQYSLTIQYDKAYGEVDAEQGKFDYLSEHTIEANANYGYHFSSWSDGVTDNPRTLILTKDTTLIATFAPNKYQLELIADATMGAIEGEQGEFDYLSEKTFEAVPNNGYQFTGWSDGVTDNPRTITLTCDTTFTALFEYNMHEVTVLCNPEQGSVEKSGETYHTAECTITATPNYGYHFVQWNDGEMENPRTFVVIQDTTFTAEFAKNVYTIEKIADAEQGRIEGPSEAEYLTEVSLEAIPNEYRQFVQWSDGNTDNPRTIILTQDTTFAAQFDLIHYPVIFLDYNGAVLSEQSVAHNSGATAPEVAEREGYRFIGWSADIEHITASTFVIALYEKKGINITYKGTEGEIIASEEVDIHIPDAPVIEGNTFAGWFAEAANNEDGIILRATYTIDHPTVNEDVTIEPGSTTAGVTFPYITGTLTYVLVVRDLFGFVVCKIMFNATGHLLGVAFAPGHKSAQQAQTEGFQFTVEGLIPSTTYEYEFVAHDETDAVIETLAGSFTTTEDVTTEMANPNQSNAPQKILYEGIMYILKNREKYNAQGARIE